MLLQAFTSRGLKYLPAMVLQFPARRHNTFLSFVAFAHINDCKNFSVCADTEIIDTVDTQKYLNYLKNHAARKKFPAQEMDQLVTLLERKEKLEDDIKSLEKLSTDGDKELEELMESEKKQYLESMKQIKGEILDCIMPKDDDNDSRNAELQVIAGIGGLEAKLFSKELIQMYLNYAAFRNWECIGGTEDGSLLIYGENVFGNLKQEAGVHRVQRVPVTENSGRTQTSTCSVVILPQPRPSEIIIKQKDLIIEKMKASSPGGQNANKTENCVRVKHVPSGIYVVNQDTRLQQSNIKSAIEKIRVILFQKEQEKLKKEREALVHDQAGENDYSDKIRTYNFPQGRVTDHRIHYTTQNLRGFLSGGKELDYVIQKVKQYNLRRELLSVIRNTLQSVEYKSFTEHQVAHKS